MDEQRNNESFQYTYSAKERSEVERIRKKYLPQTEDKMEQLRRLDRIAPQKAQIGAITLGTIGALVLGLGMSLFMTDLGAQLGISSHFSMLIGIITGVIGLALVALAYPAYNAVLKKERARIAPEILRLTDELMQ